LTDVRSLSALNDSSYSTPEHRAAIEKLGVSPLHRLSFQSMAYQQLAL
jgi:ribonuclease HII